MVKFNVYADGKPADRLDLEGAYLIGTDGVPLRAESIEFASGLITCAKRAEGAAGLCLLWPVAGFGRAMLETVRLPERDVPYNLHVELARSRLMWISQKREDWGLYDYPGMEAVCEQVDAAREKLIEALKAEGAQAAALADESLQLSMDAGEQLARFHADIFLTRRRSSKTLSKHIFGCVVDLYSSGEAYVRRLTEAFQFATVPIVWRQVEPKEQEFNFQQVDGWINRLAAARVPIKATPLVALNEKTIPDWLYIWEHDYETVRDLIYEHVRRVVERYADKVAVWDVVSGLHAENVFSFTFDQLMELTRMAATLTKQLAPRSQTVVDLILPWGEYYARNQRTIPPMLYADMAVQSGINFDAFGLQCYFGVGTDGMYVRDLMQISAMIDRFANLGKSLHITAVQVPSSTAADRWDAWGGAISAEDGGEWREPWSEQTQARWLRSFCEIALSKPFVEGICWRDLADYEGHFLPHGGLLHSDLTPKLGYEEMLALRSELTGRGRR